MRVKYDLDVSIHDKYKEHMHNSVKAFSTCFTEGLLINLETNRQVVGYSPKEIYTHNKDNFLFSCDISCENTKTKVDLKVAYDTDNIVQVYYKKSKFQADISSIRLPCHCCGNDALCMKFLKYKHISKKHIVIETSRQQHQHG